MLLTPNAEEKAQKKLNHTGEHWDGEGISTSVNGLEASNLKDKRTF